MPPRSARCRQGIPLSARRLSTVSTEIGAFSRSISPGLTRNCPSDPEPPARESALARHAIPATGSPRHELFVTCSRFRLGDSRSIPTHLFIFVGLIDSPLTHPYNDLRLLFLDPPAFDDGIVFKAPSGASGQWVQSPLEACLCCGTGAPSSFFG